MLIISFIVITFLFIEKNRIINEERVRISQDYNQQNNDTIKQRVEEVYTYIQRERSFTKDELKKSLKTELSNAYNIAISIYEENKDLPKDRLKKLVIEALRDIRFNDGRGYFFIYDKKGVNHLLPYSKELEGKDFINHRDSKGTLILQDMIKLLSKSDSSFYEWYWFNPNSSKNSKMKKKIGLVKNFEPFDWFIGTGEYLEDFEQNIQERVLRNIREIKYGKSGYIFVINYDTVYLSHTRKDFIGKKAVTNNDTVGIKKVITDLIEISKNGSGYYSYIQNKKPGIDIPMKKVSFVKGLNEWGWMIGTGYYKDDVEEKMEIIKSQLNERFEKNVYTTIAYSLGMLFILTILSIYFSKLLQDKFMNYTKEIEEHIEKNNKQQNLLSYQSKMAAMGEMIGNIAHQWRQPLSVITSQATGLKLQKEISVLTDDFLIKGLENITDTAKYLSSTIDDFRNFFKPDNKKTNFFISGALKKGLRLVEVQFKNKNIEIFEEIEDIEVNSYENQLVQVVINILNNAKDELIKKDDHIKKYIFISAYKENEKYIIDIKDNAGGIPDDIIDRVFEPYFTTKHKSQGTGIGLFMSREIVVKNLEGSFDVTNINFTYENISYNGASFKITLYL